MSYRVIRASEIGEYLYCRRAWWLRRTKQIRPGNIQELVAGTEYHEQHGKLVTQGIWSRRLVLLFIFLAVTVLAYWLVLSS